MCFVLVFPAGGTDITNALNHVLGWISAAHVYWSDRSATSVKAVILVTDGRWRALIPYRSVCLYH